MIRVKTQLSVVIENRPGILNRICDALASHKINIEGFSAYGETEHGIVRLITSDPDRSASILGDRGLLVTRTEVLTVKLANRPAGLLRLARRLADRGINIDYAYGSSSVAGRMATLYMRVEDPQRACKVLGEKPGSARPKGKVSKPAEKSAAKSTTKKKSKAAAERSPVRRRPAAARATRRR
jgi:hypothetical protein